MNDNTTIGTELTITYKQVIGDRPQTRKTDVKGEGVSGLVAAAEKAAGLKPNQAFYLIEDAAPQQGVFLKGWTDNVTLRLGPIWGLSVPETISPELGFSWSYLQQYIEAAAGSHRFIGAVNADKDDLYKPRKTRKETDEEYAAELAAYETRKAFLLANSGPITVEYPVAPQYWSAQDLTNVMVLFLQRIPPPLEGQTQGLGIEPMEHRGHEKSVHLPRWRYRLRCWGRDHRAWLDLPAFPARAMVEWLEDSGSLVNFVTKDEEIARLRLSADLSIVEAHQPPADRAEVKRRARRVGIKEAV